MWYYKQRPLKSVDGRSTTFSVDSSGTVFDNMDSGVRKVGKINGKGDITVFPKYAKKHGERLKQLGAKNDGCLSIKECKFHREEKGSHKCLANVDPIEASQSLVDGKACTSYEAVEEEEEK